MRKVLASALLIMLAALPLAAEDITPTISVSGTAEVSVTPDTAYFTISASSLADTSEEARKLASGTISSAVEILSAEFGVEKEDIRTEMLTIYPEYRWTEDGNELIGQRANESISVKIRNIESLGDIYTKLLGINGIEISNVELDKEDKSGEIEQSRINAVLDARAKAETYAKAAGVKLGDVLSITDNTSSSVIYPRNVMYAMAATDESAVKTEYRISDITVSSTVSMTFEIIND